MIGCPRLLSTRRPGVGPGRALPGFADARGDRPIFQDSYPVRIL